MLWSKFGWVVGDQVDATNHDIAFLLDLSLRRFWPRCSLACGVYAKFPVYQPSRSSSLLFAWNFLILNFYTSLASPSPSAILSSLRLPLPLSAFYLLSLRPPPSLSPLLAWVSDSVEGRYNLTVLVHVDCRGAKGIGCDEDLSLVFIAEAVDDSVSPVAPGQSRRACRPRQMPRMRAYRASPTGLLTWRRRRAAPFLGKLPCLRRLEEGLSPSGLLHALCCQILFQAGRKNESAACSVCFFISSGICLRMS